MPSLVDVPSAVRPFAFHGMELDGKSGDQRIGDCPFCLGEDKFYISSKTGQFDCKKCHESGNATTFLRLLWKSSKDNPDVEQDFIDLAKNRGLRSHQTLKSWGVVKSCISGDWLVPGYGADGNLNQLYKYAYSKADQRWNLFATPELTQQLFGVNLFDAAKKDVFITEGPWDGMALYEVLRNCKWDESGKEIELTSSEATSLYADSNVVAVPGCSTFKTSWSTLLEGKHIYFMYDSDHPKTNPKTNAIIEPAGFSGLKKAVVTLSTAEGHPKTVSYLNWGVSGYDSSLPSGYDIRDVLTKCPDADKITSRIEALNTLFKKIELTPGEWVTGKSGTVANGSVDMECVQCESWIVLNQSWRAALKWTEGLDIALSVMLASITSTKAVGDQLWTKVIGPASCGKSTLCEAVSIAKKYVVAKSTIRGFHSGYKTDKAGSEDHSLIAQLYDKTLVTKDGDTLLQSPNISQILSEARDLYDCVSRTHYRHGLSKDYQGIRITWILCGTSSLRALDSSELGERFLDCVIMEEIDPDLEDEILWRVANRTDRSTSIESNGDATTQHDPDLVIAMQLTGGYVNYLRSNASRLLNTVTTGEDALKQCIALGKFVAYMRARPSKRQEESAEREFAARLVSQLVRLAKCLAVVLNKNVVDEEVMKRVSKVALDTARGRTFKIAKYLYRFAKEGTSLASIAINVSETEDSTRKLLMFLKRIGVVEILNIKTSSGTQRIRWRLLDRAYKLYRQVTTGSKVVTETK